LPSEHIDAGKVAFGIHFARSAANKRKYEDDTHPLRAKGTPDLNRKMQATIGRPFELSGVGLHTGKFSRVTVSPAGVDQGLVCSIGKRTSSEAARATWDRRVPSMMSTTLRLADGQRLRTVEHMLASFAAFGVDNAFIEVDGNEIPILDGSAAQWCAALESAGIVFQDRPSRIIEVRRPV